MKVKSKFLQEGGAMPAPQEQMPEQGNPQDQLMAVATQVIEQLGPEGAAMLAQLIMEMLQGGGAPQQPVYAKKGGKLVRVK